MLFLELYEVILESLVSKRFKLKNFFEGEFVSLQVDDHMTTLGMVERSFIPQGYNVRANLERTLTI